MGDDCRSRKRRTRISETEFKCTECFRIGLTLPETYTHTKPCRLIRRRMVLPSGQNASLLHELRDGENGLDKVEESLCSFSTENAKAFCPKDEMKVKNAIRSSLGCPDLVSGGMCVCTIRQYRTPLPELEHQICLSPLPKNHLTKPSESRLSFSCQSSLSLKLQQGFLSRPVARSDSHD